MNLASSSYYYKPKTDVDGQVSSDAELRVDIERIEGEFAGYGYRRLGKQLRREGIYVNDKRIRRVAAPFQALEMRMREGVTIRADFDASSKRERICFVMRQWPSNLTQLVSLGKSRRKGSCLGLAAN